MNGILNIYKESGYTSHDVVARMRGICKQKKIGHTGTLDPEAEGVLPICLGSATRLCDMLTDKSKMYETIMLLGATTDTQDAGGRVIRTGDTSKLDNEMVIEAISSFIREYEQLPPMYSAIKVNGQKLYDIARQGREIDRSTRRVEIKSIDILAEPERSVINPYDIKMVSLRPDGMITNDNVKRHEPISKEKTEMLCIPESIEVIRVKLGVKCSKGTYIRTLCNDIGETLGCGGCMEGLIRNSVGEFKLEDSLRLFEVEKLMAENKLDGYLKPADIFFPEYPCAIMKQEYDRMLLNGNELVINDFYGLYEAPEGLPYEQTEDMTQKLKIKNQKLITEEDGQSKNEIIPENLRLYDSGRVFRAVYVWQPKRRKYKPLKMFPQV